MKTKSLIFLLSMIQFVYCQVTIPVNIKAVSLKNLSQNIQENTEVRIIEFKDNIDPYSTSSYSNYTLSVLTQSNTPETLSYGKVDKFLITASNTREFWIKKSIENSVYKNILVKGYQFDVRKSLDEDANEYIKYLNKNNQIFHDSYLENYLYTLAYRIYPSKLEDGRQGILNIKILKDNTPNAFMLANGSLFVTTGLLSTINSEQELLAILAHEISHFVLDHSIININKEIQRKKNAEFWAGFATLAAAAADVYVSSKNQYYNPGFITTGVSIVAQELSSAIQERMGLEFSRQQELEADQCAVEVMKFIGSNPTALSNVLEKIKRNSILNGNYQSISGEGTHPDIDYRISKIGAPTIIKDVNYDAKISLINSFNAIVELNNQHYDLSLNLSKRNIDAGIETEDDLITAAISIMNIYNTDESNKEAYTLIQKAKSINVYPLLSTDKQEALVLIRLKRNNEAKQALLNYKVLLENEIKNNYLTDCNKLYDRNKYIIDEIEWTCKMINKIVKL